MIDKYLSAFSGEAVCRMWIISDLQQSMPKNARYCMNVAVNEIKKIPQWKTAENIDDFYYIEEFENYALVGLTDHVAKDGSWYTTHGRIQGDAYPYDEKAWDGLREKIAGINKPVFTFSHYSFAGGNRPSKLQNRLLPLPENVVVHFYGHAHIGDKEWAAENWNRKISKISVVMLSVLLFLKFIEMAAMVFCSVIIQKKNGMKHICCST